MRIRELHNQAMDLSELADIANIKGEISKAMTYFEDAFDLEKKAAFEAYNNKVGEPTISVLFRSAASLALNCNRLRDAEKLIGLALSGEPPIEIAEELRDLLETVNFSRHLDLRGITLQEDEVRLVIAGNAVGFGFAKSEDAINRINLFEQLATRTIERKAGRLFRKSGKVSAELKDLCEPYISLPMASSMAFVLKFGSISRATLPGFSSFEEVIDDINDNIELVSKGEIDKVRENIQDEAYFMNFLQATKALAPDGDDISLFGLTSMKHGVERKVELTMKKTEISEKIKEISINHSMLDDNTLSLQPASISGVLSVADLSGKIKITSNDRKITIDVPDGLSDIVKTYWEQNVIINYIHDGGKKKLVDINLE